MSSSLPENFQWGDDLAAELMTAGGAVDELAHAAAKHGVMITISFIPGTIEDDTDD